MKFCDERIQKYLLNGGKIKRESCDFLMFLSNNGLLCYQSECHVHTCCINKKDLTADDWEIVEPEYDWDKIIKDKVLCIFIDNEDFHDAIISTLKGKDDSYFYDARSIWFMYCKPIKASDYNIINDLKEYEV